MRPTIIKIAGWTLYESPLINMENQHMNNNSALEADRKLIKQVIEEISTQNKLSKETTRKFSSRLFKCAVSNSDASTAVGLAHSYEMIGIYLTLKAKS